MFKPERQWGFRPNALTTRATKTKIVDDRVTKTSDKKIFTETKILKSAPKFNMQVRISRTVCHLRMIFRIVLQKTRLLGRSYDSYNSVVNIGIGYAYLYFTPSHNKDVDWLPSIYAICFSTRFGIYWNKTQTNYRDRRKYNSPVLNVSHRTAEHNARTA